MENETLMVFKNRFLAKTGDNLYIFPIWLNQDFHWYVMSGDKLLETTTVRPQYGLVLMYYLFKGSTKIISSMNGFNKKIWKYYNDSWKNF